MQHVEDRRLVHDVLWCAAHHEEGHHLASLQGLCHETHDALAQYLLIPAFQCIVQTG